MTSASTLRTAVKRQVAAARKSSKDHAKGKVLKGPSMRKLRIRA